MTFDCLRHHEHQSAAERDGCDAKTHDTTSLAKLAQVGFTGPAKIHRVYDPGRLEQRDGLALVVFSEEQIVPWEFVGDEEE